MVCALPSVAALQPQMQPCQSRRAQGQRTGIARSAGLPSLCPPPAGCTGLVYLSPCGAMADTAVLRVPSFVPHSRPPRPLQHGGGGGWPPEQTSFSTAGANRGSSSSIKQQFTLAPSIRFNDAHKAAAQRPTSLNRIDVLSRFYIPRDDERCNLTQMISGSSCLHRLSALGKCKCRQPGMVA